MCYKCEIRIKVIHRKNASKFDKSDLYTELCTLSTVNYLVGGAEKTVEIGTLVLLICYEIYFFVKKIVNLN